MGLLRQQNYCPRVSDYCSFAPAKLLVSLQRLLDFCVIKTIALASATTALLRQQNISLLHKSNLITQKQLILFSLITHRSQQSDYGTFASAKLLHSRQRLLDFCAAKLLVSLQRLLDFCVIKTIALTIATTALLRQQNLPLSHKIKKNTAHKKQYSFFISLNSSHIIIGLYLHH